MKRIYKRENSVIIIIEEGIFLLTLFDRIGNVLRICSLSSQDLYVLLEKKTIIKVQELTRLERKKIKQKGIPFKCCF